MYMVHSAPFGRQLRSRARVRACVRACGRAGVWTKRQRRWRRRAAGGGMRGVRGGAEEEEEEERSATARQRGAVRRSARPATLLALPPAWLPALARAREQALACRASCGRARARSFCRRCCCCCCNRARAPPRKTARPCRLASRSPRLDCLASAAGSCSPTWYPPAPSMQAPSCLLRAVARFRMFCPVECFLLLPACRVDRGSSCTHPYSHPCAACLQQRNRVPIGNGPTVSNLRCDDPPLL